MTMRPRPLHAFAALLLFLTFLGWQFAQHRVQSLDGEMRRQLMDHAVATAEAIEPSLIAGLSFTEADVDLPAYDRLRGQLQAVNKALPQIRWVYTMTLRDDQIVFGPDSADLDDPDYSPPGDAYLDPPAALRQCFRTHKAATTGPYTDQWGTFVSAFAPAHDRVTDELLLVIGIDVPAEDWQATLAAARRMPLAVTALLIALLGAGFALRAWRARQPGSGLRRLRNVEIAMVGLLGGALTAVIAVWTQEGERIERRLSFDRFAQARSAQVADMLKDIRGQVESLGRFFAGSELVESHEFAAFAGPMIHQSAVQYLAWAPRVTEAHRKAHEAQAAALSLRPDWSIWEIGPDGEKTRATGRSDYYPLLYLTPDGSDAVGFDLASQSAGRSAIEQAMTEAMIAASEPLDLPLPALSNDHGEMVVLAPLIALSAPDGREDPTSPSLVGVLAGMFDPQALIESAFHDQDGDEALIALGLVDLMASNGMAYRGMWPPPDATAPSPLPADWQDWRHRPMRAIHPILIFGRSYAIITLPTPHFYGAYPVRSGWTAAVAGLLVTAAMMALVGFARRRQAQLEELVQERTAELRRTTDELEGFFDLALDLLCIASADGRFLRVNRAWEAILGYTREELEGRRYLDFVHPDDLPATLETMERLNHNEQIINFVNRYRTRDGAYRHIEWRSQPRGGLSYAAARDITERMAIEAALRESEEYLKAVFDSINDAVFIDNAETGDILDVNATTCQMYGYTKEELLTLPVGALSANTPPFTQHDALKKIRLAAAGTPQVFEWLARRRSGELFWVEVSIRQVCIVDQNRLIVTVRDITHRREAEASLRRSEAEKSLILATTTEVFLYYDLQLRVVWANQAAGDSMGMAPEDLIGRHCHDLWHGREEPCENCPVLQAASSGQPREMEITMPTGRIFHMRGYPVHDEAGELTALIEFGQDITDRKQAEEALRRRENLLRKIYEVLPVGLWITDKDGRLISGNPAGVRIWGGEPHVKPEEYGVFQARRLPSGEPISAEDWALARTVREGITIVDEMLEIDTFDGKKRIILNHTAPVLDDEGNFQGAIVVNQDITDLQKAEAARLALERQVQQTQKLESLGVLAGGIAHDFNNILMAVLGHAELALDDISPLSPARDSLRQIETAARRAADLCRQMLAYSGKAPFTMETLDLRELIEEMAHLLKTTISKKAILNLHLEQGLPPIHADASQIRQVLMNLIINASEAIGERSGVITVSAGATRCDSAYLTETYLDNDLPAGLYIHLEVTDTGCGMDAETQARIFEPFFSTKFTGRGLGMAAVLGIVRAHRGALKLYTELGKGTTFKILFPALESRPQTDAPAEGLEAPPPTGQTVLLVDDEESLLALGAQMLERLGYTVMTAPDGREAVDLYRQRQQDIDLILMDLTMPHMDGVEAFREMRRINPRARIVLASGYSRQDAASRFAGKGLAGFIQKPYTRELLRDTLAMALGGQDSERLERNEKHERTEKDPGAENAP